MFAGATSTRNKVIAIVCFVFAVLNFVAYYPGFLSPDGIDQYGQALTGRYEDWHPPMMAVWWHILNHIHRGPQLMLMYQIGCLWASGYLVAVSVDLKMWKWLVLLLMMAPFVQNFAGYIVKDSQMALSWLLAFAIMFFCQRKNIPSKLFPAIVSALLLFYGLSVRTNALPACIPLCAFWGSVFGPPAFKKAKLKYGILFASVLLGLQLLITAVVIRPIMSNSVNKLFLHDMVAIYVKTGDTKVFPPVLYSYPRFDTAYLRTHYHPATFDMVWWNNDGVTIREASDSNTAAPIRQYWWNAVSRHPTAYLKHRLRGFLYYLRVYDRGAPLYSFFYFVADNNYGFHFKYNALKAIYGQSAELSAGLFFMQPWFWFFLSIVMVFLAGKITDTSTRMAYKVLIWSTLLYQLPSIFIYQVDTDFRYFYWNCIAQFLALCLFLADRISTRKNKRATIPQQGYTP